MVFIVQFQYLFFSYFLIFPAIYLVDNGGDICLQTNFPLGKCPMLGGHNIQDSKYLPFFQLIYGVG